MLIKCLEIWKTVINKCISVKINTFKIKVKQWFNIGMKEPRDTLINRFPVRREFSNSDWWGTTFPWFDGFHVRSNVNPECKSQSSCFGLSLLGLILKYNQRRRDWELVQDCFELTLSLHSTLVYTLKTLCNRK